MKDNSKSISLSLVSHTNVGKTTLARTMLEPQCRRGEGRAARHRQRRSLRAARDARGRRPALWDTPGFGDSARLADRLQKSERPIGWFVSQVWDRFTDRALWSSQQAVRNAREEADVVLYLVNAAEDPERRRLRRAGDADPAVDRQADHRAASTRWGRRAGRSTRPRRSSAGARTSRYAPAVRKVLALDAFARCWVQEGALLKEVARLVPEDKRDSFGRLHRAWQTQRREAFDAAMNVLAGPSRARGTGQGEGRARRHQGPPARRRHARWA